MKLGGRQLGVFDDRPRACVERAAQGDRAACRAGGDSLLGMAGGAAATALSASLAPLWEA